MDKISYALGLSIGTQLKTLGCEHISSTDFVEAINDIFIGNPLKVSPEEAQRIVNEYVKNLEESKGQEAKESGKAFLEENGKKDGVITLPSGLQYKVLKEGNGKSPKSTDNVKCHYEGTLIDGTLFDSSIKRGEPAVFPLNGVIAGWTEGLQLMKEGGKYRFFIPYQLGYGSNGAGSAIPPYATLVFDVELLEVL